MCHFFHKHCLKKKSAFIYSKPRTLNICSRIEFFSFRQQSDYVTPWYLDHPLTCIRDLLLRQMITINSLSCTCVSYVCVLRWLINMCKQHNRPRGKYRTKARLYVAILSILVQNSNAWSSWHSDNRITHNTSLLVYPNTIIPHAV